MVLKTTSEVAQSSDDIAVVGMACRFPGANDCSEYWRNLVAGQTFIKQIPPERWRWQDYWGDPATEENKCNSKWGGFIEDVDCFDRAFFGVSPREAETMDPQQRLGLELAWQCFEDASICPSKLSGREVGVFVGVANLDYKEIIEQEQPAIDAHYATGIGASVIANRVSFYYNLRGPSLPLDTACSSSLFAIHAACRALKENDCELALAGGISLLLTPRRFICFSKAGMLSPSGAIRAFDDGADGMVRGEGGGLILLKPLAKAVADGNKIVGIIKGSAVNHNGRTHSLTYPSAVAQAEVISKAHQKARVAPSEVTYVETHGTGTPKGDPIEFEGLRTAFRSGTDGTQPQSGWCGIGSVKCNLGHLEAAAGIAGTIKVLLALQHKTLPPSVNFKVLNSRISLDGSGFYVVDRLQPWEPKSNGGNPKCRLAGVSSFGFAGTNVHLVLAEAPPSEERKAASIAWNVLLLSAKTMAALRSKQLDMLAWLGSEGKQFPLSQVCACLLHGREHFGFRFAAVGRTHEQMVNALVGSLTEEPEKHVVDGRVALGEVRQGQYQSGVGWVPTDARQLPDDGLDRYLNSFSQEYVKGLDPDSLNVYESINYSEVTLPTYPFEKTRCRVMPRPITTDNDKTYPIQSAAAFSPGGVEKPQGIVLKPLVETTTTSGVEEISVEPSTCPKTAGNSRVTARLAVEGPIVPTHENNSVESLKDTRKHGPADDGVDGLLAQVYQGDLEIDEAIEQLSRLVHT
jgi:acyl transferase domain-containing protein